MVRRAGRRPKKGSTTAMQAAHRPLPAMAAEIPDASLLPNAIRLVKLRADYLEFAVYKPLTADGINWARLWMTHRINVGNSGSARLCRATLAQLYETAVVNYPAANNSTGTQAQSADVSIGTAASVARSGTWTASATFSGVTDVRYSTAIGDYVEYSVTGASRIVIRAYGNGGNGGIANILITESAVEIPDGNYATLPGKLVNWRLATGPMFAPIASGLNPASTYVVRITVDATNPASSRVYDGGLLGYDGVDFDATGIHGTAFEQNIGSNTPTGLAFSIPHSIVVHRLDNATRIDWRYLTNPSAGFVAFTVYDNAGAEIDSGDYDATEIDTYASGSTQRQIKVASGLALGTYYLHVRSTGEKRAAATAYRMFDYGALAINETAAGDPETGVFDDLNVSTAGLSAEPITIQGTGNVEAAIRARPIGSSVGVNDDFASGTHGNEGPPTGLAVTVDEVTVDYAGAPAGTIWNCTAATFDFDTTLLFATLNTQFATLHNRMHFDRDAYYTDVTRTMTESAIVSYEYVMMLQAPKPGAAEGSLGNGTRRCIVDVAPVAFAADGDNDTIIATPGEVAKAIIYNGECLSELELLNPAEVVAAMEGFGSQDTACQIQDRADGYTKFYRASTRFLTGGEVVPSGHVLIARRRMRFGLRSSIAPVASPPPA